MVEPLRLMRAASAGIECPQVSDSPSQLRHPKALANSRSKHDNASASWERGRIGGAGQEATVDCYGEAEQATGLFMMMQDSLELPFETVIDGSTVTIQRLDL